MQYNTENIDRYLSGELSEQEVKVFEEKMEGDEDFAYEVELHQTAVQVVQYPNFMRELKQVRREIAEEDKVSNLQPKENDMERISKGEEETPVIDIKTKRFFNIRRLMTIAASLLLIAISYFTIPILKQQTSPMAMTSVDIVNILGGGTKGESTKTPLQQGIEYFKNKEYQTAIPLFDQVIRENPNRRAEAQFLKADALHRLKRKEEARAVLQSIKQSDKEQLYNKAQSILENYK